MRYNGQPVSPDLNTSLEARSKNRARLSSKLTCSRMDPWARTLGLAKCSTVAAGASGRQAVQPRDVDQLATLIAGGLDLQSEWDRRALWSLRQPPLLSVVRSYVEVATPLPYGQGLVYHLIANHGPALIRLMKTARPYDTQTLFYDMATGPYAPQLWKSEAADELRIWWHRMRSCVRPGAQELNLEDQKGLFDPLLAFADHKTVLHTFRGDIPSLLDDLARLYRVRNIKRAMQMSAYELADFCAPYREPMLMTLIVKITSMLTVLPVHLKAGPVDPRSPDWQPDFDRSELAPEQVAEAEKIVKAHFALHQVYAYTECRDEVTPTQACARCHLTYFCGREHQRITNKEHANTRLNAGRSVGRQISWVLADRLDGTLSGQSRWRHSYDGACRPEMEALDGHLSHAFLPGQLSRSKGQL